MRPACSVVTIFLASLTLNAGCVSRDEYLREKFAGQNASGRASGLENDLADERSRNQELRTQLEACNREKDTIQAMIDNQRTEIARLDNQNKDLLSKMNDMLKKGIPSSIDVVEVKLPPELDRALKDFAARFPDAVEYDPVRGVVRWKADLTFDLGSDLVKDTVKPALTEFAKIVNSPAARGFEVGICGHTDTVPIKSTAARFPTNWHLSCARAIAVMFALHEYGVDYMRMACTGYGEHRPREQTPPNTRNERNRRVEIFLLSSKGGTPGAAQVVPSAARVLAQR